MIEKQSLLNINLNLGKDITTGQDIIVSNNLSKTLIVDLTEPDALLRHMNEISSELAFWLILKAQVTKQCDVVEVNYKKWLASKKKNFTDKKSEIAKEEAVMLECEDFAAENLKKIEATYNKNIISAIAQAVELKSKMLSSINASIRADKVLNKENGSLDPETVNNINNWNQKVIGTKI